MRKHLHHGHSFLAGGLMVLLLERHAFVAACLLFAGGFMAGRTWGWWTTRAQVLGMALRTALQRHEQRAGGLVPVYSTRARRRSSSSPSAQTDEIPF
jgi:hypothetical protein